MKIGSNNRTNLSFPLFTERDSYFAEIRRENSLVRFYLEKISNSASQTTYLEKYRPKKVIVHKIRSWERFFFLCPSLIID